MAKITPGVGGRGTVTVIERKKHPDSHFELGELRIEKAHDGSFIIKHHMRLKKQHQDSEEYMHGYRDEETHTTPDADGLVAHLRQQFGKKKE